MSQTCDSRKVVLQLANCLQLDEVSLAQPNSETKRLIRWVANKAKQSNRLDVVRELRDVTPAGTTGEFNAVAFVRINVYLSTKMAKMYSLNEIWFMSNRLLRVEEKMVEHAG